MRIILWISLTISAPAHAYFQQELMRSRNRDGETTAQWTLVDWLQQKNKIALLDQWLAMNTSNSLFDISMHASGQRYKLKTDNGTVTSTQNQDSATYGLDMYISVFGIHGEYELVRDKMESYGGSAGLRLLGSSSRTTNLAAHYGIRVRHDLVNLEQWQNQYAEGQLTLYIIKNFGINGQYRHYFPADSNLGNKLEGHKVTAGAFIEFLPFRVQGSYFMEPLRITRSGVENKEDRTGYDVGVKLIF